MCVKEKLFENEFSMNSHSVSDHSPQTRSLRSGGALRWCFGYGTFAYAKDQASLPLDSFHSVLPQHHAS